MNSEPLEPVDSFKYLGHTVAYNNSNWATLYQNIWKVRRQWAMVGKVVTNMGETVRAWGMLYKAVVKSVLLYGRESWLTKGAMLKLV